MNNTIFDINNISNFLNINKVCGSGLKAVHLAYQSSRDGDNRIVIAGGQENMSLSPHLLLGSRRGTTMGDARLVDSMLSEGLHCAINHYHMGITAENVAAQWAISREEQDAFAAASQIKAIAAIRDGRFKDEIVPIEIPQRKGAPLVFDTDEFPREGTTAAALSKLRPAFKQDGSVTAGNASGINDGAAAVLVMTASIARDLGLKPLARITACAKAGVDPKIMGAGPIPASRACLKKAGWTVDQLTFSSAGGTSAGFGGGGTHFAMDNFTYNEVLSPVPEPETYAMLAVGLGLMGAFARRRKQNAA